MTNKLNLIILIVFTAIGSNLIGQSLGNKWWIVQDLPDKIVYIDTSSVKSTNNQISVWSLVIYRSPIKLNAFKEEISKVKSQYLFNIANKKYSVVGTLYYNRKSRIVGEAISSAITGSGERFTLNVQPNSSVEKVLQKSKEFLSYGVIKSDPSLYMAENDSLVDPSAKAIMDNARNVKFEPEVPVYKLPDDPLSFENGKDIEMDTIEVDTTGSYLDYIDEEKEPVNPTIIKGPTASDIIGDDGNNNTERKEINVDAKTRRVYDPISGKYISVNVKSSKTQPTPRKETPLPAVKENKPPTTKATNSNNSYNESKDRNVKSKIWSDGNLFVLQLSSWRSKNIADKQVNKYKNQGHDAFVFKKYISSKNATYYRVRIGYFNSLNEAEKLFENGKIDF